MTNFSVGSTFHKKHTCVFHLQLHAYNTLVFSTWPKEINTIQFLAFALVVELH